MKHPGQCRKVRTYGRTKPHVDPGASDKKCDGGTNSGAYGWNKIHELMGGKIFHGLTI